MLWFTCSVMSDSSGSHGLRHTRPPCPSVSPISLELMCIELLSWWWHSLCHPTISSSVSPFSSCLQCFGVFSNGLTLCISWPKVSEGQLKEWPEYHVTTFRGIRIRQCEWNSRLNEGRNAPPPPRSRVPHSVSCGVSNCTGSSLLCGIFPSCNKSGLLCVAGCGLLQWCFPSLRKIGFR